MWTGFITVIKVFLCDNVVERLILVEVIKWWVQQPLGNKAVCKTQYGVIIPIGCFDCENKVQNEWRK